jgi:hypothetical protein
MLFSGARGEDDSWKKPEEKSCNTVPLRRLKKSLQKRFYGNGKNST